MQAAHGADFMTKTTIVWLAAVSLGSGCATGYGTLAAAGAGAALGTIGTVAASARGESVDGMLILEGAAAGALFGVVGAAVAAAVAKKEARQPPIQDEAAAANEARLRALEAAIRKQQRPVAASGEGETR